MALGARNVDDRARREPRDRLALLCSPPNTAGDRRDAETGGRHSANRDGSPPSEAPRRHIGTEPAAPVSTPDTGCMQSGAETAGGRDRLAAPRAQLVRRWLPAGAGRVRLDPGRRAAALVAAVVLLGATGAGVVVWRSRPVAQPVPALPPVTASTTAAGELVVSVAGQILRPGLVRLPAGARVADAVQAAGGPVPGADLSGVNLARRLSDGEHVLVASAAGAPPPGEPAGGGGSKVNLNTATLSDLDALPGIGPVTARRILDWREANGRFASVDQLREVDGIGEARFAQLRELVTV
jgi:competence protein ComEA